MTPTLLSQLTALEAAEPAYAQAARNVREDLRSTFSPNGNICEGVALAIEAECCKHGTTASNHLHEVIEAHRANGAAAHAVSRQTVPPDGLARVMPMSTFISYHALDPNADNRQLLKNKERREKLKNALFGIPKIRMVDAIYEAKLECQRMKGTTSGPRSLTWWTNAIPKPDGTAPGKTLMQRLALCEDTLLQAEKDRHVVVVTMPEAGFTNVGEEVYKPNALDGYRANTKFRPELSGKPHGLTFPDDPALAPLPELVSASILYKDMGTVEVTLFAVPF
jgi:hypothetical protein